MNQLRTKAKVGMGGDKHRTIENIGESIGASCHEVVLDSRPDLGAVRIMPSHHSFSSISPIYCKTSCPKHDVKLHNHALTITTTTRGTCLWSRYPVLVIIRELEDLTSRPSVAS